LKKYISELTPENQRGQTAQATNDANAFNDYKRSPTTSTSLKIVEDPLKGVMVQNLLEIPVFEASELMDLIALGSERRFVASTGANKTSSRSHAILIFNIEGSS
jgi:hypothetical protein